MPRRAVIFLLALVAGSPVPAPAEPVEHALAYDVAFRGLRVAGISGVERETDQAHAAALQIRATGLAAAFARVRFDMAVKGFRAGDSLRPFHYRDSVDTEQRQGAVVLLWPESGGPILLSDPPAVEPGVTPVTAGAAAGAADRLTLMWRLARPQADAVLCGWRAMMFDGAWLSSLAVGPPLIDGDSATCSGVNTRLAGFPEAELTGAPRFPFEASYSRGQIGLWELTEASAASIYGSVRIFTRD